LPRKNILPLRGRPMIAYAIRAAVDAREIDRVIVTTEDEEIARLSLEAGAEVPFMRPQELATDTAPAAHACLHVIDTLVAEEGSARGAFALIQATNPLVIGKDIDAAVTLFKTTDASATVSLQEIDDTLESVVEQSEDGKILNVLSHRYGVEPMLAPRQQLGRRYRISGSVTVMDVAQTRIDINYYFHHPLVRGVVLPAARGVDVDNEMDFKMAGLLLDERAAQ
jgi:CMP-N,N'-diacetyllegionaminic acid synthase